MLSCDDERSKRKKNASISIRNSRVGVYCVRASTYCNIIRLRGGEARRGAAALHVEKNQRARRSGDHDSGCVYMTIVGKQKVTILVYTI